MNRNSHWFDDNGRYVPLSERDVSNHTFARVLQATNGAVEYTQVGKYLHIFVKDITDIETVKAALRDKCDHCKWSFDEPTHHTYSWIDGSNVVVAEFRSA